MPFNARCPNPSCGQVMAVQEQYAGMRGKCPHCGTVFAFPPLPAGSAPPAAAPVEAAASAPPGGPPPIPTAPPGPGFLATIDRLSRENGLDQPAKLAFFVGLVSMFFFLFSTLLPWVSLSRLGSVLGISTNPDGLLAFLFVLGVGIWAGMAFFTKVGFPASLVAAAGLGVYLVFDLLSIIVIVSKANATGAGLILAFIASLPIAGSFVFVSTRRPLQVEFLQKEGNAPFIRNHGPLLAAVGLGFLIGLIVLIVRAASSPGRF